jgi:YfiR/HmsC-like
MPALFVAVLAVGTALGTGLWRVAAAGDRADLITDLKVAYLYHFTRFVEWPRTLSGAHFVICVAGAPALAEALGALEHPDKQVDGRPFQIRPIGVSAPLDDCRILVIGEGAAARTADLAERSRGRPILLVGDAPGLARQGAAIGFVLRTDILGKGQRLRFEINPAALTGRGLKVSSQLYDVGEAVR